VQRRTSPVATVETDEVNGPPGLSLAELVDRSPPSSLRREALLKVVIKSELAAGRLVEREGYFALRSDALHPDQLVALRELKLEG
jgi:hypothetical protein